MESAITISYDVRQPAYEDMDAPMPAVTDQSGQSEVRVKPVPRPRSKLKPQAQCNTNNAVDSADQTSNTTKAVSSQLNEYPEDYKRPHPVRPPPRPPMTKSGTCSKPTAAVDGGNHDMSLNTEPTVNPPAVSTERKQSLRPARPPLPSIYHNRSPPIKLESESNIDESQLSRCLSISSMGQTQVSPAPSGEVVRTYDTTATDRPAVPPRPGQPSLPRSASVCENSPPQTKPPPPPFDPPPPPSTVIPSDIVYSEIEYSPYLEVLPEDEDKMTKERSTLRYEQRYQSGCKASHQQITEDAEDINGMLRWLKKVSKSDFMAPSLYGLSIEEEIRSFNQRAMNVRKALRLYNLLMMKRNESLRDLITEFSSISKSLDKMQKKNKTVGIAGGTTGAVGGVTAVLGIALAPMTMGASLIATAVGAGMVASAGGISAHAVKAKKKTVNRTIVEKLVYEYKANIDDLEHCLDFILSGMNELRRHDIARLQRAGAQPDALKMAHLSQSVFMNKTDNARKASVAHTGRQQAAVCLECGRMQTNTGGVILWALRKDTASPRFTSITAAAPQRAPFSFPKNNKRSVSIVEHRSIGRNGSVKCAATQQQPTKQCIQPVH